MWEVFCIMKHIRSIVGTNLTRSGGRDFCCPPLDCPNGSTHISTKINIRILFLKWPLASPHMLPAGFTSPVGAVPGHQLHPLCVKLNWTMGSDHSQPFISLHWNQHKYPPLQNDLCSQWHCFSTNLVNS